MWDRLNSLKQRVRVKGQPLHHDGGTAETDGERAEVWADLFAKYSQKDQLDDGQKDIRDEWEPPNSEEKFAYDPTFDENFTLQDLRIAFGQIRSLNKAMGEDKIGYKMLAQLPDVATRE